MKKTLFLLLAFSSIGFAQQKAPEQKPTDQTAKSEPVPDRGIVPGVNVGGVTVETGGQAVLVTGKKSFGLQEYRDTPRNAVVRRLDFLWLREGKPLRFQFRSLDLIQRDMMFTANLEDVGKFNLQVDYQGFTRFWGNRGQSVLTEASRGVFVTSTALRTQLENAALTPNALAPLAADAVANAPLVEVRSNRQRLTVTQTYNLKRGFDLRLNFMREHRDGHGLAAYGTFNRCNMNMLQPGFSPAPLACGGVPGGDQDVNPPIVPTAGGDVMLVPGQELLEPTDYANTEFGVELNFVRKNFIMGFEYRGSLFQNHTTALIYQNPFRITPAQALGDRTTTGTVGGQMGGGHFRGRFAENRMSLPPDNEAHTFTGFAVLNLPRASKISGLVSWSRWTQNQAFLPYTDNPAVTVAAPPFPYRPQPTAPLTDVAALPQRSLNGLIHTLTQDYVFTTRPARPLQFTARYNYYGLENKTAPILFPGYVFVGNSFWANFRTGCCTQTAMPIPEANRPDVTITSKAQGYHLQRALFEAAWKPTKEWTFKGGYQWRRWSRFNREVNGATENGALASISFAPTNRIFMQAGGSYSHLLPDSYLDPSGCITVSPGCGIGLEHPLLRMFDEARNLREQGNGLFSISVSPKVALSGSWAYSGAAYDRNFLGLQQLVTNSGSADASFNITENFGLFLGYGYDRSGYSYLSRSAPIVPPTDPWTRDTREHLHSGHLGFSGSFAKGRGNYEAAYDVGYADTLITTNTLAPVPASNVLNSTAFPFPQVTNQFNAFRMETSYEVLNRARLGVYYLFEPYRLGDFAFDTLTAYGPNSVANDQSDARFYYFLNVGPSSYNGHVVTVFLKFSF